MSSNLYNQDTTAELAKSHAKRLVPCFGLHPWFCHPISLAQHLPSKQQHYADIFAEQPQELTHDLLQALPEPLPLSDFLQTLRTNLESHPNALLGEVGLDKTFKISSFGNHIAPHSVAERIRAERPIQWTNLKTPLSHQVAVLEAQVDLAIELRRPVSLHCVQAQGAVSDLLARLAKKYGKAAFEGACRIDLHAFGGSAESVAQLQKKHRNVFFSFSIAINSRSPRLRQVIQSVDRDRLLLESDWPSFDEQNERLSEMVWLMAEARGWSVEKTCVLSSVVR